MYLYILGQKHEKDSFLIIQEALVKSYGISPITIQFYSYPETDKETWDGFLGAAAKIVCLPFDNDYYANYSWPPLSKVLKDKAAKESAWADLQKILPHLSKTPERSPLQITSAELQKLLVLISEATIPFSVFLGSQEYKIGNGEGEIKHADIAAMITAMFVFNASRLKM